MDIALNPGNRRVIHETANGLRSNSMGSTRDLLSLNIDPGGTFVRQEK